MHLVFRIRARCPQAAAYLFPRKLQTRLWPLTVLSAPLPPPKVRKAWALRGSMRTGKGPAALVSHPGAAGTWSFRCVSPCRQPRVPGVRGLTHLLREPKAPELLGLTDARGLQASPRAGCLHLSLAWDVLKSYNAGMDLEAQCGRSPQTGPRRPPGRPGFSTATGVWEGSGVPRPWACV